MMRRTASAGLLLLLLLPASLSSAQGVPASPSGSECLTDLYDAFGREHRLERAVLYGKAKPEDAPVTSVFYDDEGNAWAKTGPDEWKSPNDGFEGTTWTDLQMERQSEKDLLCEKNEPELQASCVKLPRRGIFEIKKTPTSDLIQPVVQSVRALQCRLRAICALAAQSVNKPDDETITITLDGCLPMTFPVLKGCRELSPTVLEVMPGMCQSARRQLVNREMQLLTLSMSYDASYRSLAQFAGMFQEFLLQFRFPLIEPLWQTVRMLGGMKDIPCFESECNE